MTCRRPSVASPPVRRAVVAVAGVLLAVVAVFSVPAVYHPASVPPSGKARPTGPVAGAVPLGRPATIDAPRVLRRRAGLGDPAAVARSALRRAHAAGDRLGHPLLSFRDGLPGGAAPWMSGLVLIGFAARPAGAARALWARTGPSQRGPPAGC